MTIDGVGGPKGPPGPGGISGLDGPKGVEEAQPQEKPFSLEGASTASAAKPVTGPNAEILSVVQDVAVELTAGGIRDLDQAMDRVVERLVSLRYPEMNRTEQRQFTAHLGQVLRTDPGLGQRIRDLLGAAQTER